MSKDKKVTKELLTREVAFNNADKMVDELNFYLEQNLRFDQEYYEIVGSILPKGSEEDIEALRSMLEKHTERAASMEYYALIRAPKQNEVIPRMMDAILLRYGLLRVSDLIKEILSYKKNIHEDDRQAYIHIFIQRWIYKFCRYILQLEDLQPRLIEAFAKEQNKEKDGFIDALETIEYLNKRQTRNIQGYDIHNFRRMYIVFSNLLMAYFKNGISIPWNLQKIFIEFQNKTTLNYSDLEQTSEVTQHEQKCLLLPPANPRQFFLQYKEISSPMRKAVLVGMLTPVERKRVIEEYCVLSIKTVADMYAFISNKLTSTEVTESQGRDWMINGYDTITEVVREKKILEDSSIPETIRKVFGEPVNFPVPEFRKPAKGLVISAQQIKDSQKAPSAPSPSKSPKKEEGPKLIDIPNLTQANSIEELRDKNKNALNIVIVQDSNVLDLIVQNWELRSSLTFPEMVEFARVPLQFLIPKMPGMRPGRRFISIAYMIALDLEPEAAASFLNKLHKKNQVTEIRVAQLERLYPQAREMLAPLTEVNKDVRKLTDKYNNINPGLFFEKCTTLRNHFMENFSYFESLISYWNLIEEIYYSIAMGTAVMGNITDPEPKDIEHFVLNRNDEFVNAYEKTLSFPEYRVIRNFIRKKYSAELQKHFLNVKIKNDLITIAQSSPINLSER
ncbi:MAG: hypothetical protein HQM11_14505 [SAR324 cluster bacterium]|nr:hypothetical protein [SAR324 cluster bacterium]